MRTRDGRSTWIRFAAAMVVPFAVVAAAIGCNALLGDTSFTCSSNIAGACPDGQTCNVTSHQCVPEPTGCGECPSGEICDVDSGMCEFGMVVTASDGATVVVITDAAPDSPSGEMGDSGPTTGPEAGPDGGPDSAPIDVNVGKACGSNADCNGGICATTTEIGDLASPSSFCTIPCCISDDCGNGNACVNQGTGGAYCVPGARFGADAGRSVPAQGGLTIGTACTTNSQCKSGACHIPSGTTGTCTDTCCNDAQCGAGQVCSTRTSREQHFGFDCVPAAEQTLGNGGDGTVCTDNEQCSSNLCTSLNDAPEEVCHAHCCGVASCNGGTASATSPNFCFNTKDGTDYVAVCFARTSSVSGSTYSLLANNGTGCGADDTKCKSGICDTFADGGALPDGGNVCVDSCCVDSDCQATLPGAVCRPRPGSAPLFRCTYNP